MPKRLGLLEGTRQPARPNRMPQPWPAMLQRPSDLVHLHQLRQLWLNDIDPAGALPGRQTPHEWLQQQVRGRGGGAGGGQPDNLRTSMWFPSGMRYQRTSNAIGAQFDRAMNSIPVFKVSKVDYGKGGR